MNFINFINNIVECLAYPLVILRYILHCTVNLNLFLEISIYSDEIKKFLKIMAEYFENERYNREIFFRKYLSLL